jgi:hypothetical protein
MRHRWIWNRFTITFGMIALAIGAWNIYVSFNDDGQIAGKVVDAKGQPVAGATVVFWRETVTSMEKVAETHTDAEGHYRFHNNGQYALVLTARMANVQSDRHTVPLWFRNQNVRVAPIVVE